MFSLLRIKPGAQVYQDHASGIWPWCKPPRHEFQGQRYEFKTQQPDAVFVGEKIVNRDRTHWICRRDGYGNPEHYGNGAITVLDEQVQLITKNIHGETV